MKTTYIASLAITLCAAGVSGLAAQDSTGSDNPTITRPPADQMASSRAASPCGDQHQLRQARISVDSARGIALGRVPGGILLSSAWLKQGSQGLFSQEVAKGTDTIEVRVDPQTGRILSADKARWTADQRRQRMACVTEAGMGAGAVPRQ
jgi:uncharacterized membrane protein YkoI